MSAHRLIDEFADAGVRLTAENGQLAFEGPREMLTPERIEELRRHKVALLAALAAPDPDAFEERAGIIEEAHTVVLADNGTPLPAPIFTLTREQAETLAAQEQGHADANSLHGEVVRRWATEIERLATLSAVSPEGAKALKRARAFISDGWALQAARLGWDAVELFGICPRAPWRRLDRTGAAFGGAVQAVTQDTVVYVGGMRRYRATVNNDGGALPIWKPAQNNTSNGGDPA
jgi:hypothetical protein